MNKELKLKAKAHCVHGRISPLFQVAHKRQPVLKMLLLISPHTFTLRSGPSELMAKRDE